MEEARRYCHLLLVLYLLLVSRFLEGMAPSIARTETNPLSLCSSNRVLVGGAGPILPVWMKLYAPRGIGSQEVVNLTTYPSLVMAFGRRLICQKDNMRVKSVQSADAPR